MTKAWGYIGKLNRLSFFFILASIRVFEPTIR